MKKLLLILLLLFPVHSAYGKALLEPDAFLLTEDYWKEYLSKDPHFKNRVMLLSPSTGNTWIMAAEPWSEDPDLSKLVKIGINDCNEYHNVSDCLLAIKNKNIVYGKMITWEQLGNIAQKLSADPVIRCQQIGLKKNTNSYFDCVNKVQERIKQIQFEKASLDAQARREYLMMERLRMEREMRQYNNNRKFWLFVSDFGLTLATEGWPMRNPPRISDY